MANAQTISEIDLKTMASLQRLLTYISNERDIYKQELENGEMCQATFDELDPIAEKLTTKPNS